MNGEQGYELITGIFQSGIQHLGLLGYLYVLGMFLSAIGEGAAMEEILNDIPVTVTAPQGKAALCYIKRDAKQLLNETAHVIAENYSTIGKPFDTPEVTAMVESIKKMLSNHYGIKHYEEYQLIFEQISFPPYTESEDYLSRFRLLFFLHAYCTDSKGLPTGTGCATLLTQIVPVPPDGW